MLFLSNYDGSREAYMDDFINKVGWGLNIIFGNGFGYPRTRWMIFDGAKNELRSRTPTAVTRSRRKSGTRPIPA